MFYVDILRLHLFCLVVINIKCEEDDYDYDTVKIPALVVEIDQDMRKMQFFHFLTKPIL